MIKVKLKNFFPKHETELLAFVSQGFGELRRPAVEDGDFPFLLILNLLEDFVPVGSTGDRAGLQAGNQITLFSLVQQVQG